MKRNAIVMNLENGRIYPCTTERDGNRVRVCPARPPFALPALVLDLITRWMARDDPVHVHSPERQR